ncbi:Mucosa-associated lymphoid tissue lymphoma like protein [Argiope bruennichi]|uniref:Mucosa-associated lymphoid tissue lymphoma like protein n=1 Tax=Argiope bruennichi TaxID=94029 RepID=A0A8T0FX64_ARGBR|nr:Mucosa-associated lymphoid tissue lymphoma like protein [Argiope bruennichi]
MDFEKFLNIKLILDKRAIREEFLQVLPKEIFSINEYNLMEIEGNRMDMSPGKWLLTYLGNIGGCVSDLIYWFEQMNLEQALVHLKEEEPLQIIEQPTSNITVNEGEKLCITCKASGYPHPEYQWFKDDEELLLEQEEVLLIPCAKEENSGSYVCKISKRNADSSTESLLSDHVAVIVLPCKPSNSFAFTRQYSEKQPLSTQPINTIIKADLEYNQTKLKECQEQNNLSRKCHKSEKIIIVKQPRSYKKVAQGSMLWFKCIAKSSHPVKYQWYRDGRKLDDQTSTKLLVDELYPDQETGSMKFKFFCEVYNDYDQVISDFATVELSESDDKTKFVAEEKIAFLIANDKYKAYKEDLATPAVDVVDMAKLLKSINFKVIVFRNLNLKEMQSSFQAFCRLLKAGAYAVVFFAGHGFECYGQTYLQPVDCSENFLPEESMYACRKQPPELRNVPVKIYDASMRNNTVYGYATSFLNGAYESDEGNSYFVKHLKKYITHDKSIQEIIFQVQRDFDSEPLTRRIQHPVIESSLCAARKLCDELQNPPDPTYQLPCWFYQKRNYGPKQTPTIDEFKCSFIIEVRDHMDVYLNGIDINLYVYVKEDTNLDRLRKSSLVINIPSLKVRNGVLLKNDAFNLGANLIINEKVLGLQKIQNADVNGQILLKYEQDPIIPIEFSFTVEKIMSMNIFFS